MTEMPEAEGDLFKRLVFLYCTDNLVKLVVFIPSPTITSYLLTEVTPGSTLHLAITLLLQEITLRTFISNMGGLLGLCMGLSFVSVVEVVFYLAQFIFSGGKQFFIKERK